MPDKVSIIYCVIAFGKKALFLCIVNILIWWMFRPITKTYKYEFRTKSSEYTSLISLKSLLLALVLFTATLVAFECCSLLIMQVIGEFYSTISDHDVKAFYMCIWKAVAVVCVTALIKTGRAILEEVCALGLRERITVYLHHIYCDSLIQISSAIENVDQRICQDVDLYSKKMIQLYGQLFCLPFVIIYYSWILAYSFGLFLPVACYIYFILGYSLSYLLMRRVVPLVFQHEKLEGDLRYFHVGVRNFADSIFLLQGQRTERIQLNKKLSEVLRNQRDTVVKHVPLFLATNIFDYFGSICKSFVLLQVSCLPINAGYSELFVDWIIYFLDVSYRQFIVNIVSHRYRSLCLPISYF